MIIIYLLIDRILTFPKLIFFNYYKMIKKMNKNNNNWWKKRTEEGCQSEAAPSDLLDEVDADEGAQEIDRRHQSRQPNRLRRLVESAHLDDRCAVIPTIITT